IQDKPELYPLYKKTPLRKCVIAPFPYLIFYRETDRHISIVAVAHGRRRPGYWRKRRDRP
ncbi:MAG: type II toxin-antitoxin system RelE/ParE family toxin, partial [Burkholderiales bacterium]